MCVPPGTYSLFTSHYSLTFEHRNGNGLEGDFGSLQKDVERPARLVQEIEVELEWLRHLDGCAVCK